MTVDTPTSSVTPGCVCVFVRHNTGDCAYSDVLGRMTYDIVTAFGSGVDKMVKALGYSFDPGGRLYQQSSYSSSTTFTAATTVNQVQDDYNNLGQLTGQYQDHFGQVSSSSPACFTAIPTCREPGCRTIVG